MNSKLDQLTNLIQSWPGMSLLTSKRLLNTFLRDPAKSQNDFMMLAEFFHTTSMCDRCGIISPQSAVSQDCENCHKISQGCPVFILPSHLDYLIASQWRELNDAGWIILPGYLNPTAKRNELPSTLQYCLKILSQHRPRTFIILFNLSLEARGLFWILKKHQSQLINCSEYLGHQEGIFRLSASEILQYRQKVSEIYASSLITPLS